MGGARRLTMAATTNLDMQGETMTTEPNSGKTQWTLADEIAVRFEESRRAYEALVAEFQKALGSNPIEALDRWSESMVERQTEHEFWATAHRLMTGEDSADVIEAFLTETEGRIRRYFDTISTRMFHNAIQRARAEACLSLTEHTIPWLRRLLAAARGQHTPAE